MNQPMHWHRETDDDGIVWLHLDMAGESTNVLSAAVLEQLQSSLDEISAQKPTGLVLLSDKSNGFIAGADIREFSQLTEPEQAEQQILRGQSVLHCLEFLPFPSVCLIHGFCLGGGLEMALACTYRVARDDPGTRLGLPEVRLGIFPGLGGTVRSIRTIGPLAAMDMMLTGRAIRSRVAKKLGLVDQIVPQRHLLRAARRLVLERPKPQKPGWIARLAGSAMVRPLVGRIMRKQVAKRARPDHYPAPYALIDHWVRHGGSAKAMYAGEAAGVARLITGATARNLIRVFFLQEELKSQGRAGDFDAKRVHVIGGGLMGGDIAAWCAVQGMRVSLQDVSMESLAAAVQRAHKLFKRRLKTQTDIQAALDRLMPDPRGAGLRHADVVIEAIFENVEAKHSLYREIEGKMRPDALLATNTSSIPLEVLGEALENPGRLVGLHFFNPVAMMQLVEVVSSAATDPEASKRATAFARRIDRLPLPVKSSPGFLVNRILTPYLMEAVMLESEGVAPEVIDRAAKDFGMPMGPVELADTVGLDICLSVAENLSQKVDINIPERLRKMIGDGHVGRKSGRGFYRYKDGKPVKAKKGSGHNVPSDVTDRLIFRLLNESLACLREEVVGSEDLLDAGVIFGTGFAPFRGGPMHYIRETGITQLTHSLDEMSGRYGERFTADPGWEEIKSA